MQASTGPQTKGDLLMWCRSMRNDGQVAQSVSKLKQDADTHNVVCTEALYCPLLLIPLELCLPLQKAQPVCLLAGHHGREMLLTAAALASQAVVQHAAPCTTPAHTTIGPLYPTYSHPLFPIYMVTMHLPPCTSNTNHCGL